MRQWICLSILLTLISGEVALARRPLATGGNLQIAAGIHNVTDDPYNASNDGVNGSTEAIRAAIDAAAASGGGIVYLPPGHYVLDTDTLRSYTHNALALSGDCITIEGAGPAATTVSLAGSTTDCSVFYAYNVNHVTIRGIRFVGIGDTVTTNTCLRYGLSAASDNITGLLIEDCEFHNFRYDGWIDVEVAAGSHDINDVVVRDCRFVSRPGNMWGTGASGIASDCIRIDSGGPPGYVRNIQIYGNWFDCSHIKRAISLKDGARWAKIYNNYVYGSGLNLATDAVQSYGIMVYGSGCSHVDVYANDIVDCWTCGIYAVNADHLQLWDNYVEGTQDVEDSSLNVGGIAAGGCTNLTIRGGEVVDCAIGITVQPAGLEAANVIDGVSLSNIRTDKGILVRESATRKHTGGVTITHCAIEDTTIQVYRATGGAWLNHIVIADNTIRRGHVHLRTGTFESRIVDNIIVASDQAYGVRIGGPSSVTIKGNRISGPGMGQKSSYGLYLNTSGLNPTLISDNTITGFYYGLYGPYGAASVADNIISGVTEPVIDAVTGDLGRDAPSMIPGTVTTYWSAGQFVDNLCLSATPTVAGWRCIGPVTGLGCTYATTATGDMSSGKTLISDVGPAASRYIPGAAVTLANAALGLNTLETEVLSWQITYSELAGRFVAGEYIEGQTSKAIGTIESDNGIETMYLVNIPWGASGFEIGETAYGHASGTTATIASLALEVADTCGNAVNDATLSLVPPTWSQVHAPHAITQTYTPTNVTEDRAYDADNTTTAELADVLGQLIADLQNAGVLE